MSVDALLRRGVPEALIGSATLLAVALIRLGRHYSRELD